MRPRHRDLAGRLAFVGLTLLTAATVPAMVPPATLAPPRPMAVDHPHQFGGAADLLAAQHALRRVLSGGFIRHMEFDPDDQPGLAIEFEVVTAGTARLIELRRHDAEHWIVADSAPRHSSVRSRRYFERLAEALDAEPHLEPAEAATRAEEAFPGSLAVEVDLLLRGGEPVYEVAMVRGSEAFDLELPARVAAAATAPPSCSYACLVEAIDASAEHGRPFAFETRTDGGRLTHEVFVLDPQHRVVRVRHVAGSVAFLDATPAVRPAPGIHPPAGTLAESLRSLERVLLGAGSSPVAMGGGALFPAERAEPGGPWRLRAWTPSIAGMLVADVDPGRGKVVLRIRTPESDA